MKRLVVAIAVLVVLGFTLFGIALPAVAEEIKAQRVAVVFEKSVRNRTVLELAVQEALRDAGYQPVLATGVRALRSERDWKRLPEGVAKVLVISDARVVTRKNNQTSPKITIGKFGRIGGRVGWQKTSATLDLKMVNVGDRALVGFGHGEGEASNLERIQVSNAGIIDIIKTAGVYRQRTRKDMVYEAAKKAAVEAIKGLR